MSDRRRYDSAMFWLAFGTAASVIGLALMTIGVTRMSANANLLASGWFDGGLGLLAIGAGLLLWALGLFLSRRRAASAESTTSGPPAQSGSAPNATAEAVKGYYREREKMMDKALEIWEEKERDRRGKG